MKKLLSPQLTGGIIGNSKMLAAIKGNGELCRIFWPHIDKGQHLGRFFVGIQVNGYPDSPVSWFHTPAWQAQQEYLPETNILKTNLVQPEMGLTVKLYDFILPEADVLIRQYQIKNLIEQRCSFSLIGYCLFLIDESPLYDTLYLKFSHQALIQFRYNTYLLLAAPDYPLTGYHCGREDAREELLDVASKGSFPGASSNLRGGAGILKWDLGLLAPGEEREIALYLAFASSERQVLDLYTRTFNISASSWLDKTASFWQKWGQKNSAPVQSPGDKKRLPDEVQRSLLTLKLLCHRETGGIIAAPEFDPFYACCGGYAYCWPRDGLFAAVALDEAGFYEEAKDFYFYCLRVQEIDGSWKQRYFTDGKWAPFWGHQIDQVGAVLWGYAHHFALTREKKFLAAVWPSICLGVNYLLRSLSPANNLPQPSFDLWEDNFCQSTYAAAATYGGLKAAAALAKTKGEPAKAALWRETAVKVKKAILIRQWEAKTRCFLRGINRRISLNEYYWHREHGYQVWSTTDPLGLYPVYWVGQDRRIDAALAGLVFPFRVFRPNDFWANRIIQAIEKFLTNRQVNGIHRYEGDVYAGGNPWVITTLWLSIICALRGEKEKALSLYRWVVKNANPLGLLPEQVNKQVGGPAWVIPLGWSHAMLILAYLALGNQLRGYPLAEK
ncbi:MAG: glucan 1,4-alpha-glucosidase [Peptococcaceae bacterium]